LVRYGEPSGMVTVSPGSPCVRKIGPLREALRCGLGHSSGSHEPARRRQIATCPAQRRPSKLRPITRATLTSSWSACDNRSISPQFVYVGDLLRLWLSYRTVVNAIDVGIVRWDTRPCRPIRALIQIKASEPERGHPCWKPQRYRTSRNITFDDASHAVHYVDVT
jgi:hypothetical protein